MSFARVPGEGAGSRSSGRIGRLLLVHAVLVQAVTFVLRPTMAYRALELDVSTAWLGVLSASFAVVPLVIAVPAGRTADRWGEKPVMLAGAVAVVMATLAFAFAAGSVAGLVLGSVVLGIGHLLSVVSEQALVAGAAAPGAFDVAFGRYTFAASLGQTLGPIAVAGIGGAAAVPDTDAIFAFAVALATVLLVCTAVLRPARETTPTATAAGRSAMKQLLRAPGLLRALLVSCLALSAVDIIAVYLPALGAEVGLSAAFVGALLAIRSGASMVSRFFLGRLSAGLGRRRLLTASLLIAAGALVVIPASVADAVLVVAVLATGLGLGVAQPLTMSWLAETAPAGLRATAMSLRLTGNRLGQVVVPAGVGAIAAGLGPAGVLWATAAVLAAAASSISRLPLDRQPTPAGAALERTSH